MHNTNEGDVKETMNEEHNKINNNNTINETNNTPQALTSTPDDAAAGISKPPTMKHLLTFALPTILAMLVMGTFGIVDGVFVSRLIDPIALSAVSIVWPMVGFIMAIGFMLGVGGNALIAKKIGEGKTKEARANFSLIIIVTIIATLVLAVVSLLMPDVVLRILGVENNAFVREMSLQYLTPLLFFAPLIALGMAFQQFFITEGKAHYSAIMSVISGIISASLNYVFIYLMDIRLTGAAMASSIGFTLPAIVGLIFFMRNRKGLLYFVVPTLDFKALGRACINGASEMVTMLAASITTVMMNNVLMDIEGPMAVAAAGIMFAGMGIFTSLFIGYASGVMPIISYNYGKHDSVNLSKTFKNSLMIIAVLAVFAVILQVSTINVLISVYDIPRFTPIHDMASRALIFMAASFIFNGFNAFASMFFTALNNGIVSSVLSFFRTLVFVAIAFLVLPRFFGLDGAWAAMPAAEVMGIVLTIVCFIVMRKKYQYI